MEGLLYLYNYKNMYKYVVFQHQDLLHFNENLIFLVYNKIFYHHPRIERKEE